MAKTFKLTTGNLSPVYRAQANGVDLTSATITCTMKDTTTGDKVIDAQSTGITIDPDQVTNKGLFTYQWQATETDTEGEYFINFEITIAGKPFTIPVCNDVDNGNPALVEICS